MPRPKSSEVELEQAEPRWRRRKDARPTEIVAAAYEVFAEKGFAATKLDEIAARAGVSKGALYLYFDTKQQLFEAVVRDAIYPQFGAIHASVRAFPGSFAALVSFILPAIARIAEHSPAGKVAKLVIGESGNFPELARVWHDEIVGRAVALIADVIAEAQDRGEVRPGDPRAFAVGLAAPIFLAVLFRETFTPVGAEGFDIAVVADQHVQTVLGGMLTDHAAQAARQVSSETSS